MTAPRNRCDHVFAGTCIDCTERLYAENERLLAEVKEHRARAAREPDAIEERIALQGAVVREVRRMVDANWIPTGPGTIGERLQRALADLTEWKRAKRAEVAAPSPSGTVHVDDGSGWRFTDNGSKEG